MGRIIILFIILLVSGFTISFLTQEIKAQSSSTWRTRVGNPVTQASSCPIPGGIPSCGSKNQPRNGCGHCGAGYENFPCNYDSLAYAMDVPAPYGSNVYLPTIGGNIIKWTFMDQYNNDSRTAIQRYGGTDEATGQQYIIKFHHSAPGSGGGVKVSGDIGARICDAPCNVGTGPHVHIEFGRLNSDGSVSWVDAPLYFCGG